MLAKQTCSKEGLPFLLRFLEDVKPHPAPPLNYDSTTQTGVIPKFHCDGTNRTRSYQNRTSGYSLVTAYEDADDEYVTSTD